MRECTCGAHTKNVHFQRNLTFLLRKHMCDCLKGQQMEDRVKSAVVAMKWIGCKVNEIFLVLKNNNLLKNAS